MAEVSPVFKKHGISQEAAQDLMDLYGRKTLESENAPYKLWQDTQERWREEIKNDPNIGGKLDQVKITIGRALDGLGDAKLANEFRQAMDFTGAGNNPAFIRVFHKMSQQLTEGRPAAAGAPSDAARPNRQGISLAQAMFPNLPSSQGG
jgi:hypothetical protein